MNATTTAPLARIETNRALPQSELQTVFLEQQPQMERLYSPHMKQAAARLARAVVTEVSKNQQLQQCTGASLLSCAMQAATLNLEIGGPLGQSYLVPYKNNGISEATFQLGYRGLITLAYRSNKVAAVTAQIVYEGDVFRVQYGTHPGIIHEPATKRGPVTHYYAVVSYKGGGIDFEVMTEQQVDSHRARFSKQGNYNGKCSGIWLAHYDAMSLKTVLRKVLKRAPIGVDIGQDEMDGDANGVTAFPVNDPLPAELPPHDQHGEITEPTTPNGGIPGDDLPPELKARAAEIAHERGAMANLMNGKGWNWDSCVGWINREFEEQCTPQTKLADLAPNQRIALAEHLLSLNDAKKGGA